MELRIEYEREDDGRWVAEVMGLAATVLVYGDTKPHARRAAQAAALLTLAHQLEEGVADEAPEIRFVDAA